MNSVVPMSTSESESSDEEEEPFTEDTKEPHEMSATSGPGFELSEPVSVLDFMKDINDFQSSLILRNLPAQSTSGATRTQQKLLDMKDLIQEEKGPSYGNLLDYAVKIQNEAILSEWTQIRLRFSSRVSNKSRTTITCLAGVLGFVQRYKGVDLTKPSTFSPVTREDKDEFLRSVWQQELMQVSGNKSWPASNAYDDDGDIYSEGHLHMNISSMARNVMLSRDPSLESQVAEASR